MTPNTISVAAANISVSLAGVIDQTALVTDMTDFLKHTIVLLNSKTKSNAEHL